MYTDLRKFDLAKHYLSSDSRTSHSNTRDLMSKQAEWARDSNDPQSAWSAGREGKERGWRGGKDVNYNF